MNDIFLPDDPSGPFQRHRLAGFEVSWAGPNPLGQGFCFGSETGQVVITDERFSRHAEFRKASASGEAVNGVAWSQGWFAVTTRADVTFISPAPRPDTPSQVVVLACGGFGVAVAPSGYFVIPLGRSGILFVKPGLRPEDPVTVSSSDKEQLNLCRLLSLPGEQGNDLIVCAGRRGGVGVTNFREGLTKHTLNTVRFEEIDVVDVCSLGVGDNELAIAAVGKDGTVILFRDILHDRRPQTLKFHTVEGTVYRILSAQGDIFLLTSRGMFVLSRLAERFIKGLTLGTFVTQVFTVPVEAADANLVGEKWLLAVGPDEVFRFDIDKMPKTAPDSQTSKKVRSLDDVNTKLRWEEASVEQTMERMAATA